MELRAPAAPKRFRKYQIEDITVWIDPVARLENDGLHFEMESFWFIKKIIPRGLRLQLGRTTDTIT